MNLFDPDRPQINNRPAYGNPPLAVLPNLEMLPKSHNLTLVSAILCIGQNSFKYFSNYADTSMIPNLLNRYHSNPEGFLESFFGYKIPEKFSSESFFVESDINYVSVKETKASIKSLQKPSSKKTLSLSDLL